MLEDGSKYEFKHPVSNLEKLFYNNNKKIIITPFSIKPEMYLEEYSNSVQGYSAL